MRPMKPTAKQQKVRQSQFFEYFISRYGIEFAITRANNEELLNRIKHLILDLAYGNIMQERYFCYIAGDMDNRLLQIALTELQFQIRKTVIYCDALTASRIVGNESSKFQEFDPLLKDEQLRQFAFITIRDSILSYISTRDSEYIRSISYKLSNPLFKRAKQILF